MRGPFDLGGVNALDLLGILLLVAAAVLVLRRGGATAWAQRTAGGLALLAAARVAGLGVNQWLVRSGSTSLYERIQMISWLNAGIWVLTTAGLVLLVLGAMTSRAPSGRPAQAG
ncbi:hypothetical protein ABEG17_06205 [Pedococcus sp. KACC 23699]|uniref:DUF3995 domain-containing protein n=1 Tax=Pedococcus sp. KACC 23699 TaxID=3149228 RepID=A0AAU7JXI0_9MICO